MVNTVIEFAKTNKYILSITNEVCTHLMKSNQFGNSVNIEIFSQLIESRVLLKYVTKNSFQTDIKQQSHRLDGVSDFENYFNNIINPIKDSQGTASTFVPENQCVNKEENVYRKQKEENKKSYL